MLVRSENQITSYQIFHKCDWRVYLLNSQKLGLVTAGGDAPGMNAAIRSVVRAAVFNELEVVGIERGYLGLLKKEYRLLDSRDVSGIVHLGGTILKTKRSDKIKTPEGINKAVEHLKEANFDGLIVIGGDGSFHGAKTLHEKSGIPMIGIPATIDNDIMGIDETIGFDTAINTALGEIDKIRDTATSHERLFVVEVMGRHSGFIALHVGVGAGAEMILVPEVEYTLDLVFQRLEKARKIGKTSSIIVMAEGAGDSHAFVEQLRELALYETRLSILGYAQRGGAPSARSRLLAGLYGVSAVEYFLEGKKKNFVGLKNGNIVAPNLDVITQGPKQLDPQLLKTAEIISR